MEANIDIACRINGYGIHRADSDTLPATDAELAANGHTAARPLLQRAGGTGSNAGCRLTGKAALGKESRGKATGALDTNACGLPGEPFVDQTSTGQGAGVAANTAVHMRGCENFHKRHPTDVQRS